MNTATFVRVDTCSADTGGSAPKYSSEYASSDATTKSYARASSAARSYSSSGAVAAVGLFG